MSEDPQTTRRNKPEQGDKFIPPPMDPYATYQTPYERRQSPEPNPFIEFRRFADKQLSDIFSGFSSFANLPKMLGIDNEMKNLREQLEKDFKEMAAFQEAFEDRFKNAKNDSYHPIPSSATAAITPATSHSDSRVPQEAVSEKKQKPAENTCQDWITTTDDNGKKYRINLLTGHAVEHPPSATPSAPMVQQPEDPKVRWRRGFRNCPELKRYQGETELDVYEALEDQQRSSYSTESSTGSRPSWSSWLSAYGYDGKQKSKQAGEPTSANASSQEDEPQVRQCEIKAYHAGQARQMNPLRNDHEFLPWIILSPYSPLSLANPEWANVKSARLHNGCEGGCSSPMHIYSHRYQDNSITEEDDKSRAMLADKVSWADAFEDLLSFERTGKMPNREVDGRVHPRNMTSSWIRDMIEKGLLGPKWWVENGEIRRDSRNDPKARSPSDRRDLMLSDEERERFLGEASMRAKADINALIPNYLAVLDQIKQAIETEDWPVSLETVQPPMDSTQISQQTAPPSHGSPGQHDLQAQNTTLSDPLSTRSETVPVPIQSQEPAQTPAPRKSVISTLTTMTTRALPDGSVETKRVLKKRFADGKEESEESTEVVHPQAPEPTSSKKSSEQQKNPGWFWT